MKNKARKLMAVLMSFALLAVSGCTSAKSSEKESTEVAVASYNSENYTLDQVVVLSRHNIRSPLSDEGSELSSVTKNEWFKWTSGKSELSLRGGVLETQMGQYFRKYLISKGLVTENWTPTQNEVRIYANSKQRTIATANYFKSGFLPVGSVLTEYHCSIDEMDPVFNPQLTFVSESFKKQALEEINELGGEKGLQGLMDDLSDNYSLLEEILDFKNSDYAKENNITSFDTKAPEIILELNEEPRLEGTLNLTSGACDALVLQCYEEAGSDSASFGREMSLDDWKKIAEVENVYQRILFSTKSIAVNVANPLLREINSEFSNKDRKFTYLCGHDSNITSVLNSLDVEDYELPNTISIEAPIGCKLTFQKWIGKDGKAYATVDLIYQSVDQLQNCTMLDMDTAPVVFTLSFEGLEKNADGFYLYDDLIERINTAIAAYGDLPTDNLREVA